MDMTDFGIIIGAFVFAGFITLVWIFNHEQNGFKATNHRIKIQVNDNGTMLYKPEFKRFGIWWSYIACDEYWPGDPMYSIVRFRSEDKARNYINEHKQIAFNKTKYKKIDNKYINID